MTALTLNRNLDVDPAEAARGVAKGKPVVVDVRGEGSGWFITAVGRSTFTVYRDGREMQVPHKHAQHGR